jgi:deoxyribodipyrimidine photo-lyase
VAGVGNDPRDRYFNIVSQAQRYDPNGDYVRLWCPELAPIAGKLIHEPYGLSPMEQQMYGIELGTTYPEPMIDLEASYQRIRQEHAS